MPLDRITAPLLVALLLLGMSLPGSPRRLYAQAGSPEEQLQAAKAEVDKLSAERDDRKRLAAVRDFIKRHPGNYWQHLGYRLWLYSAWRTGDNIELQRAVDAYLAEHADSAAAHGAVSRYLLEAKLNLTQGLSSARRSKELYELELGIDGSLDALRQLEAETRDLPVQPDWRPPSRRDQLINYLGSRFNLARYELNAGQRRAALGLVEPVIELDPFTSEEEETISPFYFIAGQAYESLGEFDRAYTNYMGAAVTGDPQNRYASQAESRLRTVGGKLEKAQREKLLQRYVPAALHSPLPRFIDITKAAGLLGVKGARVTWGDVDGDNDADLLLDGSRLFINNGSKGFYEVSEAWGLKDGRNAGVFGDVDNDGDLDLFTLGDGVRENRLLRNDGKRFTDVTEQAGDASIPHNCTAAAWLDFDRDGWLDLYVAGRSRGSSGLNKKVDAGAPDMLFRNANGALREVSMGAAGFGAQGNPAEGAGVSPADYDNDGDVDIFVANRNIEPSSLWVNGGGGQFMDLAPTLGLCQGQVDRYCYSSGGDWGDADNDGDLDLFVCNWFNASEKGRYIASAFYMNNPAASGPAFTDVRAQKGIKSATTLTEPCFGDYNNDGHQDLYLTSSGTGQRSYLYVSDGSGGWHEASYLSGSRVVGGLGCAHADFDRDGDLDLLVCSSGGVRLLRNDTPKQHWLQIEVGGAAGSGAPAGDAWSNAAGIDARVELAVGGERFVREISSAKGSGCGNEMVAHFGLGQRSGRMTLTVRFPNGKEVTRPLMAHSDRLELREYERPSDATKRPEQPPASPQRTIGR
jgi:tetratricopeptide (TPR) repeat protein